MTIKLNFMSEARFVGLVASIMFVVCASPDRAAAELLTGVTTTNALVTFDSATPGVISAPVAITGLQPGEILLGIDRRPATGGLYGLGSTNRLYELNPATGVASAIGSPGAFTLSGTAFGFDFNPVVDRIRVVSNINQDLRLNPNDGSLAATDTPLAYAAGDPNAGTTPRIVGAAYTNNFAGALTTTLFDIDSSLNILVTQGSPGGSPVSPNTGQLFTIGGLGFDTSDLLGFDISGISGIAYASMTAPAGGSSQLFTINPTVPEPNALALLCLALIGFAGSEFRCKKAVLK
jgi:hypothetical protein